MQGSGITGCAEGPCLAQCNIGSDSASDKVSVAVRSCVLRKRGGPGKRTGDEQGALGMKTATLASCRDKRLADAPQRVRSFYKSAWSGKSRQKAIRAFCLECVGWDYEEVERCIAPACPLYEYRL